MSRSSATNRTLAFGIAVAVSASFALTGCKKSEPNTRPAGGFEAFATAMLAQDIDAIWGTLATDTHTMFEDAYRSLERMDGMINQLQSSDRAGARDETGVALIDTRDTPQALFSYVFLIERIPIEQNYEMGLRVAGVEETDETTATILTRGGQEFEMILEEDGIWRVRSPIQEQLAVALDVIQENRANLEMAINLYGVTGDEDTEIARLLATGRRSEAPAAPEGTGETPEPEAPEGE